MPTLTGTSIQGTQTIYTITQAPTFIYIALLNQSTNVERLQGFAQIVLQRVLTEPHLKLFGLNVWGQGIILRPGGYPGTAINNKLQVIWRYPGIDWQVTY